MPTKEEIIIDLRLGSRIKTLCWQFAGEVIVIWNGLMLVYPDFGGNNGN